MRNSQSITLAIVLAVYAGLACFISVVTDFNKGPDEETNLAYATFIIETGRLPITYEERALIGKDANWPALYHLTVAKISDLVGVDVADGPVIKIFWDSFRYQVIDMAGEWYYLRTEDQLWPYAGRILVLHLGRGLSILFGLLALLVVYRIGLELFPPQQAWLAVAAVALAAFLPTYTFMSSVMNEDTMLAALAALYLWLLILIVKEPDRLWLYAALGFSLGLSVTVKYTTIVLPLEVLLVVAVVAYRRGDKVWRPLQRVALAGGSAIVASSWWFGWSFWYLNEIEERGWISGLLRPIFTGGGDVTLSRLGYFLSGGEIGLSELPAAWLQENTFSEWLRETTLSFWGVRISGLIPLSPYVYLLLGLLIAGAAFGWLRLWRTQPAARRWLLLLSFHISLFVVMPLLRFNLSRRIGQTAQGRHILIPTLAAVAILLVWGLAAAVPRARRREIMAVIVGGFALWSGLHAARLAQFTPTPAPMRTVPQAAAWLPYPLEAQFGETVELVSYDLDPRPEQGQLQVELAWRALAYAPENYLLKLSLLNAQNQVVSYWLGYNGQGRLPTLAWEPGDTVFDRLVLPLASLPAGDYTLQVEMRDRAGPLAVSRKAGPGGSDQTGEGGRSLTVTEVVLPEPAALTFSRGVELAGRAGLETGRVAFELWAGQGPLRSDRPTYRYPATIAIVAAQDDLVLTLVDHSGREWPATHSQANIHTFIIGPRWQSGDYRLRAARLGADEQVSGQTLSEPVLAVENWWDRRFEAPAIDRPVEANFAGQIMLLGYKLPQTQVKAGQSFPVTLYWQAPPDRSPQANFIQFNNLLDEEGQVWGGYDRRPLEYYSTLLWAPGEVVVDGYTVPVEAGAPPGEYYLDVGYYLTVGESAVNLPLVVDGQPTNHSSVTLGPVEVVASP